MKVSVIRENVDKYSVSAMCRVLKISRSGYYEKAKEQENEEKLKEQIKRIFKESRKTYGTRKIKRELAKQNQIVSRRKIEKLMKELGLVSVYTLAKYKAHRAKCNEERLANEVNQKFSDRKPLAVVVSDLTYVRVDRKWHDVCLITELFNREIIGYSTGKYKDAKLVL